jgi:hypothetical protein
MTDDKNGFVIAMEIPPGILRAETRSGRARIRLTCDGEPVTIRRTARAGDATLELAFDVRPGNYIAVVADPETGEEGTLEVLVGSGGWMLN